MGNVSTSALFFLKFVLALKAPYDSTGIRCSAFPVLQNRPLELFKINFYWSIVALQCCVSFYCTAKWISLPYTYGLQDFVLEQGFSTLALLTFWAHNSAVGVVVVGAVLCTVGCWAASLTSTRSMPVAPCPQLWQTQTSADIANCPWGWG